MVADMQPSDLCEMRQPPQPEELVLSSPPAFLDLLLGPDNQVDLIDESSPEYATWEPTIHTTDRIPTQFLVACRQYAKSISDECHSNVKTVLETAFEVTKLYYLKGADISGRTPTKTMKIVWNEPPTIEAALRGMNCLLTYDAMPTLCELVSLAFLSLALLGLLLRPMIWLSSYASYTRKQSHGAVSSQPSRREHGSETSSMISGFLQSRTKAMLDPKL